MERVLFRKLERLREEATGSYTVAFSARGSTYDPSTRTASISVVTPFAYNTRGPSGRCDQTALDNGHAGAVSHELLGHAHDNSTRQ